MAIESYTMVNDGTAGISELKTWMEANATDYFDSFVATDNVLECKIGNDAVVTVRNYATLNTKLFGITLANGSIIESANGSAWNVKQLYKTSSGIIMIGTYDTGARQSVVITKTNDGNLAFFALLATSGTTQFKTVIMEYNGTYKEIAIGSIDAVKNATCTPAGKTALVPVCLPSGAYTPDAYRMAFSEYSGFPCQFEADGTKYATDGYFALKE